MKLGLREQFSKIKDNWLFIVILIALFVIISAANSGGMSYVQYATDSLMYEGGIASDAAYGEMALARAPSYYPSSDFAPEVEDRLIIKTGHLTTETERGKFSEAETDLKNIIKASNAYLLNENAHKYETGRKSYYTGNYMIKVEVSKYDSVVSQLKKLGEVKSFTENQNDITGSYTNLENQLAAEKSRLERYQEMYDQATSVSDKLELSDRIFNQERLIKYYEDAIKNIDRGVQYSTIYFNMNEKQSEYISVDFIDLGEIARSMVNSINFLIKLIFVILPWIVIAWLANFAYKKFKK